METNNTPFIFVQSDKTCRKVLTAQDDLFKAFGLTNFVCKKHPRNKFTSCVEFKKLKLKKKDFKLKRGSPRCIGLKTLAMKAPPLSDLVDLRNVIGQLDNEDVRSAFALGSAPLTMKKHK
jgi:hypothetical protein